MDPLAVFEISKGGYFREVGGYKVMGLAEWSYIEVRLSCSMRKSTSIRPWRSSTTSGQLLGRD